MKIGAFLLVRNEMDHIDKVIDWHLNVQQFDVMAVMDNGSWDGTFEKLRNAKDPRIVLSRTEPGAGYRQDVFSNRMAQELFDVHGCDWVVPVDADECWISRRHGTVRQFFEKVPATADVLLPRAYNMVPTVRDDPNETDYRRRILHADPRTKTKAILRRFHPLQFGNHDIVRTQGQDVPTFTVEQDDLVRLHYHHIGVNALRRKVLTQVEGFLLHFGDRWLQGGAQKMEGLIGLHHFQQYKLIRNGRFDDYYRTNTVLSEEMVQNRLAEGTLFELRDMQKWVPEVKNVEMER